MILITVLIFVYLINLLFFISAVLLYRRSWQRISKKPVESDAFYQELVYGLYYCSLGLIDVRQ